jgi:Na+/H+ antiporter NhaC
MESYGFLSLLPPLLALGMAIKSKQVYPSLLLGIWLGWTIQGGWNPLAGLIASVNALVGVFGDRDRTLTILLSLLIGALIAFTQYSGGMKGFVDRVSAAGLARDRRSAGLLAWVIGFVIFVEANIGVFVSGPVSRPIFDRLRISREKLAYILDSTADRCAPCSPPSRSTSMLSWRFWRPSLWP